MDEAVARLQQAYQRQKVNEKNDPLEFIFGDLIETFTEDETIVLAALAHFTEPARAEWLLPLASRSETAVLAALDGLRDRALLIEDDNSGTWFLPPLASRFLRQRRSKAVGTTGERLAREAYALALQYGGLENAPYAELGGAWPTIQAALPLLIAGDNASLQKVCDSIYFFLEYSGRWDELLSLCREAEAKAVAAGDRASARRQAYLEAWLHFYRSDGEALQACTDRLSTYVESGDAGYAAAVFRLRGMLHHLRNDDGAAINAFEQGLDLLRSVAPESNLAAYILAHLSSSKICVGDLDGAEAAIRDALRIGRNLNERDSIAGFTGLLADVLLARFDWRGAEDTARKAMELARGLGHTLWIAADHHRLAQALLHQDRAAEALPHAREAVSALTKLRHVRRLAEAKATQAACEAACSSP